MQEDFTEGQPPGISGTWELFCFYKFINFIFFIKLLNLIGTIYVLCMHLLKWRQFLAIQVLAFYGIIMFLLFEKCTVPICRNQAAFYC